MLGEWVDRKIVRSAEVPRPLLHAPLKNIGYCLFALGLAGLGALSLLYRDFALTWQPVPPGVPGREWLACVSGALLVGGGVGMFLPTTVRWATFELAAFVSSWLVLLQLPRVAASPGDELIWLGFCENALLVAGGWVLFAMLAPAKSAGGSPPKSRQTLIRSAQILYALALPVIGLSHFVYAAGAASMVPSWLPFHLGFAYLTGAGHIAAGAGLILGIMPRLAAKMEALMLSCFVLLLHLPGVVAAPTDRTQWTMLCVATAYTGACWALAASFQVVPPWSVFRRAKRA